VELLGTDGTLQLHTLYPPNTSARVELHRRGVEAPGQWIDPSTPEDFLRQDQLVRLGRASLVEHLVGHLETGAPLILDGARARHTVAVIEAAELSAREGRFVDIAG
jgi:predicted dehydrogenase